MKNGNQLRLAIRSTLAASSMAALVVTAAQAQDTAAAGGSEFEQIVVTGTRITIPGVQSSSPIVSIGAEEIAIQQQPEVEKILRILPITAAADSQNVNNGTAGAATVNLRGLGAQRNLIMINGKRITPYDINGIVDTSVIPTALIERIDIITGGASAVYGSDAISGAINFILKDDFEGVELNTDYSVTEEGDGDIYTAALTLGANVADGKGNIVLGINYSDREGVQLGERPLGELGIETATGAGYEAFKQGSGPVPPPDNCGGENSVGAGGSTTTLPTRGNISGVPASISNWQFREDGTLGAPCGVFNFNPYNYYQTPQERWGGTVMGNYEINEYADAYARFSYTSTNVRQQIAPSGIFGTPMYVPMSNPFIGAQARAALLQQGNTARLAGSLPATSWTDRNNNGVVDEADDLRLVIRRRTVEFGERSTEFNQDAFQFIVGTQGDVVADWTYDVSFQYGESTRTHVDAGYTNVTNFQNALYSKDGVTCGPVGGATTSDCVPINVFGGQGTITSEMAAYSAATALERRNYDQKILHGHLTGPVEAIKLPWAANALGLSVGAEYRDEFGATVPDECKKLAPASCLGGAGGNTLPIRGGFRVSELFAEAILPIVNDVTGFQSLDLEVGYRYSDYSETGTDDTYKYGLSWKPVDSVLVRVMNQRATRAPNVGELAAPQTTGLDNALNDPCSVANPNPSAEVRALCISTGQSNAQVGQVEDIVAGQINGFFGTDLSQLPAPEKADTLTAGIVWTPGSSTRSSVRSSRWTTTTSTSRTTSTRSRRRKSWTAATAPLSRRPATRSSVSTAR
jgi:outer membrane receptor protein involved in Fe transport